MSPRTPTLPPTDKAMWRKLLGKVHPDAGGTHELFIWARELHEHIAGDAAVDATVDLPREMPRYTPASRYRGDPDRVPFDAQLGHIDEFVILTHRALSIGKRAEEPHKSVLMHLIDCDATDHGHRATGRSASAGGHPTSSSRPLVIGSACPRPSAAAGTM